MVVSASANGRHFDLQFDTGSDVSVFFESELQPKLDIDIRENAAGYRVATVPLSLGGISFGDQDFYLLPQTAGRVVGRLGLRSLLGKIIQIDYPGEKICLLSAKGFADYRQQLQWSPARIRSNKLFLSAKIDGKQQNGLFFDTGASLYDLLVDRKSWRELTGREGDETDNREIQGWSRNQLVTTVGAPLLGNMVFGPVIINHRMAHYTRERPHHFANYPFAADGLIGNAPFFDKVVVLDLRTERAWFGVERSGSLVE